MPRKRDTKFVFVSGGVLSSLGKGLTTSSLSLLLQAKGYRVTTIKCENYLNVDAGLINPIEHGDPFLCEDGAETDMDIGNYERFLNRDLGKPNFITMGQIYKAVIDRERAFGYDGEDVEAIPHVANEIIKRLREAAEHDDADIAIVELGGTAGEYQNALYYEASRIMKLMHQDTVIHVHVSYLPVPSHIGEPKTKPTQLSVKYLNSMGIQPDFIVARSEKPIDARRRARFALFCNMYPEDIISNPDTNNIYEIPLLFHEQKLDEMILAKLGLANRASNLKEWTKFVSKVSSPKKHKATIAIVGKYFATGDYNLVDSYAALLEAIHHTSAWTDTDVKLLYINSEKLEKDGLDKLKEATGIIVPIGWGARGTEGKIAAIKYARENKIPYLGLCFGMQLAVVEYARHVAGLSGANSTELNPDTKYPVIHIIPEQVRNMKKRAYGGTMRLGGWDCLIKSGTRADKIYETYGKYKDKKQNLASERHRHRYEFNDAFTDILEEKGLVFSARSKDENLVEYVELPETVHPFFIATQGHPEYKSRPLDPHPLFVEFLKHSRY